MRQRPGRGPLRPALNALSVVVALCCLIVTGAAGAQTIKDARYADPTTRYAHGVLGDAIEHETLLLTLSDGRTVRMVLPESAVFEDTAPRLLDLDGDGSPEVVVVESDQTRGARLAVYDSVGRIDATPYIGTRNRWLAPIGAADLDGDGFMEIAYIDRPHLAKTLRIWRYANRALTHVADMPGVTNHRIGERDIAGGIRICADNPEIIVATANWSQILAVTFDGARFNQTSLNANTSRIEFAAAMACKY